MFTRMKTQKRLNMNIGNYTKTLRDDLRKGLLITLTLLFVCPGVWGANVNVSQASDFGALTDGKYTLIGGNTYNVSGSVEIDGYLEIPAEKNVTIHFVQMWNAIDRHLTSAQDNGYVILNKGTLTISGLGYIQGGYNSENGGGIYNDTGGVLNLEGAVICGNTAQYGGGIYNASGATINMTTNTSNYIGYGSFYNNAVDGGGIYNAGGTVNISESITRFQFNKASNKGGGIYNASGNLILTNGEFTQNLAAVNGGGIYLHGGELRIGGGFSAHNNKRGTSNAITLPLDNVYLPTGKIITVESALNSYNGVRVTMETPGTLTNDLTSIGDMHNIFSSDEDGIETYYDDNKVKMRTYWSQLQTLINNADNGGTVSLTRSYSAHRTDGPLSVTGKTVTINLNGKYLDRNLKENKADGNVISVANTGHLIISGSGTIKGGNNSGNGGGIVNEGELTMNGGTISGNTSLQNGGGIYSTGTLNIQGGTITGNAATTNGGGVYHDNVAAASFNMQGGPSITGNLVNEANNNIYIPANNVITRSDALTGSTETIGISVPTPVPLTGTIFTSGLTTNEYLVFKADDTNYDISRNAAEQARYQTPWLSLKNNIEEGVEVKLTKNYTAPTDDNLAVGAGNTTTLDLNGFTINRGLSESAAAADGYLINIPSTATLTIKDTSTSGNGRLTGGKMDANGGCIINEGTLNIQSGIITGNSATGQGGAIYNNGTLNISGGTINNNSTTGATKNGGAIYNETTATLDISGGTISGNQATGQGGAIYNASSNFTLSGGTISSNTAACEGGGIYNHLTLTVSGGTISSNNTTGDSKDGGGIYNANSGTLNIQGGTIQNNIATGLGGGVYVHAGGSINMRGEPTITGNTVNSAANNVYLPTGKTITIDGALSGSGKVGVTTQAVASSGTLLTSGLSTRGSYTKFSSDLDNTKYEVADKNGEAQVQTMWTGLQTLLTAGGEVTLGKDYTAIDGVDGPLSVTATVTLNLNSHTINRNLNSAVTNGNVITNSGDLTITGSGTIRGGYNEGNGGGIINNGTLTISSGTISYNKATGTGGGIYHNGTAFNLSGNPTINGNTVNSSANNVYLVETKKINISGSITGGNVGIYYNNASESKVFTTNLNNGSHHFFADVTDFGIGLNSSGEAIAGKKFTVNKSITNLGYIKFRPSGNETSINAVQGEVVKFYLDQYAAEHVPYTLTYNPVGSTQITVPGGSYPVYNTDYVFVMPAQDVTITASFPIGWYCGDETSPHTLNDMKWVIDNGTLRFVTKDSDPYAMKAYGAGSAPWNGYNYTSVYLPKNITTISPYAFCDQTRALTSFEVEDGGSYFKAVGNLLFSNDEKTLYCYPSGKTSATTYEVPATVTSIADGAFAYNTTLTEITVAGGNTSFHANDGILYDNIARNILYCYPAGKTGTTYTVPLSGGYNVTTIKPYAFAGNSNLSFIYLLHENVPIGGDMMFDRMSSSLKIMVKAGLKTGEGIKYNNTSPWSDYISRIYELTLAGATVTLNPNPSTSPAAYEYTGNVIKPTPVSVVSGAGDGLTLTKDVDYTVNYNYVGDDYTKVGRHTINITGKGNYTGTSTTATYDISWIAINPGSVQYMTLYCPFNLQKLDLGSGTDTYVITNIDWAANPVEITLQSVGYVKANTPVLIWWSSVYKGTIYNWRLHEETDATKLGATYPVPYAGFKGVTALTEYETLKGSTYEDIYALRNDKFVRVRATGDLAKDKLPAYRCYIGRPLGLSGAPAYISIGGNSDDTTGITMEEENGKIENLFSPDWYTIDGVKLNGMPTKKGIYLNNGRKVIIK